MRRASMINGADSCRARCTMRDGRLNVAIIKPKKQVRGRVAAAHAFALHLCQGRGLKRFCLSGQCSVKDWT